MSRAAEEKKGDERRRVSIAVQGSMEGGREQLNSVAADRAVFSEASGKVCLIQSMVCSAEVSWDAARHSPSAF